MAAAKDPKPKQHEVLFRVLRATTRERVEGARLTLRPEGGDPQTHTTDEDGDCTGPIKLEEGTWDVTVAHEDYRTLRRKLVVPVPEADRTGAGGRVLLRVVHLTKDIDQRLGAWCFGVLIALLLVLVWVYLGTHDGEPDRGPRLLVESARFSNALGQATEVAQLKALSASAAALGEIVKQPDGGAELRDLLAQARKHTEAIAKQVRAPTDVARAKAGIDTELKALFGLAQQLALQEQEGGNGASSYLWDEPPDLYLEVFLWALAGILVRLVFTVGGYLRWHRFYRNGIYQHITLFITAPLLTIVFVLLISLVKIEHPVLTVDFSDPRILIGVSFLLAATPWKLWEKLLSVADRVVGNPKAAQAPPAQGAGGQDAGKP